MTNNEKQPEELNQSDDKKEESHEQNEPQPPEENAKKPKFTITDRRFWARKKKKDGSKEETESSEYTARKPAYVEELEQKLKVNEEKLRKYIAAYKEHQDETSAFRQRMNKTLETRIESQLGEFFREFLDIIDNFGRSLSFSEKDKDFDGFLTGVNMIYQQMVTLLKSHGVEKQDRNGLEFDPHFDEVIEMVPQTDENQLPNTIIDELQKCYLFKGNLLRSSKVRIVKADSDDIADQKEP